MRKAPGVFIALLAAGIAFATPAGADRPAFVDRLIARLAAQPKTNPPASVWQYRYHDRTVYYIPPSCCDVPSELYAGDGGRICSPDGGFSGGGDGKCPDFFETRSGERLIWADDR
jgi:hypothetical protein